MNQHQFVAYAPRHFVDTRTVENVIARTNGKFFFAKWLLRDGGIREGTFRVGVSGPTIAARALRVPQIDAELNRYYSEISRDEDAEPRTRAKRLKLIKERELITSGISREPYEPATHDLIRVWDCEKAAYRMLATECVLELRTGGFRYLPGRTEPHKRRHVRTHSNVVSLASA
jgi:hypothetical protein